MFLSIFKISDVKHDKIRDLLKVKLYTKEREKREREKKRKREREKKKREREKEKERDFKCLLTLILTGGHR